MTPNSSPGGPGTKRIKVSIDITSLGIAINNYCYGKSQVWITRDFLLVDLRKKLNSLNC